MHGKVVYLNVYNIFIVSRTVAFTFCSFIHSLFTFLVNAFIVAVAIKNFLKCVGIGKLPFTVNIQKKLHSILVLNFLCHFCLLICNVFFFFLFPFLIQCRDDGKFRTVSWSGCKFSGCSDFTKCGRPASQQVYVNTHGE